MMKQEIRNMLCDARSSSELMLAIDCVQKLDVEHHFEEEIVAALESLYRESYADQLHRRVNTLHEAALLFRLLRQTRYPVSSDHKRGEFMPSLTGGSHGIVSLLEASYLNTGEGILYEANRFATHHLNSSMPHFAPHFAKFIRQTLAHPYHVSLQSYRARRFLVSLGGGEQGRRKIVEEFARRDFKEVQLLHLQELEQVTSWWETLGLARELKFARDQPSKWYTWSMTVLSNPKFSSYRVALTKVIAFVYLIDDIFDVYGSLDELKLFVKAMNKWELSANIDPLPICQAITHENVSYLETYPNLISCPATILRLWDDLGSAKDEEQDGKDGSFLECFMKENPHCSFEVAKEEVMRLITKAWEELNKESFSSSTKFSRDFVKSPVWALIVSVTPAWALVVSVTPVRDLVVSVAPVRALIASVTPARDLVVSVTPVQALVVSVAPVRALIVSVALVRALVVSVALVRALVVSVAPDL
ncbi:hypothetical protein ZIOFF_070215 [Zingiber officinale]|uniref:Uncharacterized protein n=1 Tax=Zingiber officinale TaxID=94328 RepID=A0A8J5C4T8_ZINOF|nr:hypothetical protein ZIOFF_070215 [Zingiber officinale]